MLSSLTILLFCTSVLAIPSRRFEVTYPSLETSRSGIKIMKLRVFDQDIVLNLEPAGDVISEDFTIMDEQGEIEPVDVKSFKRKLYRDQKKGASLHIDEDGFIEIDGIINSKFRIEPSESQNVGKYGMKEHVIFETFDEKRHFRDIVYNLNLQRSFSKNKAMNLSKDQCVEIEYVFLADKKFRDEYRNLDVFKKTIGSIVTQVQNLLDTLNLNIKIKTLAILIFVINPPFLEDSLIPGEEIFNVAVILPKFGKYICEKKETGVIAEADIILFLSRREIGFMYEDGEIYTDIVGASNLGGACEECKKVGFILWEDDMHYTAVTVAHESAHLIGSPHDSEGGVAQSYPGSPGSEDCPVEDGFILGDNEGENEDKFSTCTIENVKYFLSQKEASCLITNCKNRVL